jgi:hypothetical protein
MSVYLAYLFSPAMADSPPDIERAMRDAMPPGAICTRGTGGSAHCHFPPSLNDYVIIFRQMDDIIYAYIPNTYQSDYLKKTSKIFQLFQFSLNEIDTCIEKSRGNGESQIIHRGLKLLCIYNQRALRFQIQNNNNF